MTYVMFMGNEAYGHGCTALVLSAWGQPMDQLLAHELTHVWQFRNGRVPPSTIIKGPQAWFDNSVYDFTPGNAWNTYNIEQQAKIVEKWYKRGCVERNTDDLWRYIRDDVRKSSS